MGSTQYGLCTICGGPLTAGHDCIPITKPAPAPLPLPLTEEVKSDLEEATAVLRKVQEVLRNEDLLFAAEGLRSVFHVLSRHTDLTRRLAEVEAELAEVRSRNGMLAVQRADAVHLAKANPTQAYQRIQQFKDRAEAAEARVREMEAEVFAIHRGEGGCTCQGCGKKYTLDVIVPDSVWERIKPPEKPEGAGLLCGQCIADRLLVIFTTEVTP